MRRPRQRSLRASQSFPWREADYTEKRLRRYPDSRILTRCPSLPIREGQWLERLPAYSGATVPASHRLPAQTYDRQLRKGRRAPSCVLGGVRSMRWFVLACCAAVLPTACAARAPVRESAPQTPASGARVVTLVPSFADDVYAVGAGAQLVGVSAFTDAPRAKGLPRVADASSVDDEAIVALRPTLDRRYSRARTVDRAAAARGLARRLSRRRFVRLDLRERAAYRRAHRLQTRSASDDRPLAARDRAAARADRGVPAPAERLRRARQRSDLDGRLRLVYCDARLRSPAGRTRQTICMPRTASTVRRRWCGASPTCSSPTPRSISPVRSTASRGEACAPYGAAASTTSILKSSSVRDRPIMRGFDGSSND